MKIPVLHFISFLVLISVTLPAQPYPIGHRTMNFTDPSRNNRAVPAEVYYPAQTAGNNTPVENGTFPVIVFGHKKIIFTNHLLKRDNLIVLFKLQTL